MFSNTFSGPITELESRLATLEANIIAAPAGSFGPGIRTHSTRAAFQTLARWRRLTAEADAARAPLPTRTTIIAYRAATGTAAQLLATDAELLTCLEAARLSATCRIIRNDTQLTGRFSEEARATERVATERAAGLLLSALLGAGESTSEEEPEFLIDEDGHWHERGSDRGCPHQLGALCSRCRPAQDDYSQRRGTLFY